MDCSNMPHSEYPRPRMVREQYTCLNGIWQCAFTDGGTPDSWQDILVPYPPESEMSGVGRVLRPGETLWYKREFEVPEEYLAGRLLLHFGGVDEIARVSINGKPAGAHRGAYSAFTVEITDLVTPGSNTIELQVVDTFGKSGAGRGKQSEKPGGIWYTPMSGIWQTVWVEPVPRRYIDDLLVQPLPEQGAVAITVFSEKPSPVRVTAGGMVGIGNANKPIILKVEDFKWWTPEDPVLYPVTAKLSYDTVTGYYAMRSCRVDTDSDGVKKFFLNGEPLFLKGILDQGIWPESLYTPPSDEALVKDITMAKELGFNMLRKHAKTEPERWYYHCDRLGMLVWQDIPNGGANYTPFSMFMGLPGDFNLKDNLYRIFSRGTPESREVFRQELREIVTQLRSYPSVTTWVPFNEGWGQFDALEAEKLTRELDPTRPVDHASGWHDQGGGDYKSRHVYFRPYRFRKDRRGRAVVLSEFGGYTLAPKEEKVFSYRAYHETEEFLQGFRDLMEKQMKPAYRKGLCGFVYTQLTDAETERNGLITADRSEYKLPPEEVRRALDSIFD